MMGLLRPHIPLVHYRSAPDRIPADERFDDEDDGFIERPHIPLSGTNRKHIPNWYARRIEKLGKKGMVRLKWQHLLHYPFFAWWTMLSPLIG